ALNLSAYIAPCVLCFLYALRALKFKKEDKEYIKIMVDIPAAFALRGIVGWILSFVFELAILLYINLNFGADITFIVVTSLASTIFVSLLAFTLIFFTLETLNRNVVLPSLYPDGNISGSERMSISSIKSLFLFYFFSASLFPAVFLGARLFFTRFYHIEFPKHYDFCFAGILLAIGFVLTILIYGYFQKPLKKLTASAQEISRGNYGAKTLICSNDEMGALGDSFNAMAASLKEKEFMRDTFGKIVTPQIRDYLLTKNVALGGETLDVTVMFCDIRGFTTLSENMPPEKIVSLLNEYFTGLEKCVAARGGVINKYIGDAIMVLFGAPIPSQTHAQDALMAALDMRTALAEMNKSWAARGLPEIHFGIGIHSGPVLAGNIGAANRMEYTVIGDTVNTASRIEGLCKTCQKDLLISQSAAGLIQAQEAQNQNGSQAQEAAAALPPLQFVADSEIRGRKERVRLYTAS
ncbi:MAG: adenylate/guanylate cyclase domain-containing protein, partial [Treponema sp.]|nr:adenylate/guanylate cyclase domain-containing protein [Treponema sp.]